MPNRRYEVVIIGAGQSGPPLAQHFGTNGTKTAIIESAHIGGSCVNYGCTPTKAMIASARIAHAARHAAQWGLVVDGVRVDMNAIIDRKDQIVINARQGLEATLHNTPNLDIIRGKAHFIHPNAVQVGDDVIEADRFFLNTGTRPRLPDFEGADGVRLLTNKDLLELRHVPDHLVILGGSYIGLEFAQMFRRFGSRVTIIEQSDQLIDREDQDISAEVTRFLTAEGITVRTGIERTHFSPDGDAIRVGGDIGDTISASHVLVAVGRVPNTAALRLDAAGVNVDDHGYVEIDDFLKTSADHIWALGDINGKGQFTHTSYNDYEIVAHNLFNPNVPPRRVSDRHMAYALYTDPALGRVGLTEQQARERGKPFLLGKMQMQQVSRAKEEGSTAGLMKVVIDAESEQFLGAAILGIRGDEVVHTLIDQMYAKAPYTVIRDAMHIHPTVSEMLPMLLQHLERIEPKRPS